MIYVVRIDHFASNEAPVTTISHDLAPASTISARLQALSSMSPSHGTSAMSILTPISLQARHPVGLGVKVGRGCGLVSGGTVQGAPIMHQRPRPCGPPQARLDT